MDVENEEKMRLIQEMNRLKLDLNQFQQEKSALELELHQKEEIILKAEAEAQQKEAQYKLELKQLRENLTDPPDCLNNEELLALKAEISKQKSRDEELKSENVLLQMEVAKFKNQVEEMETLMINKGDELKAMKTEHDIAKNHLANLEFAFSDIHAKYERSKGTIAGYASNEGALREKLVKSNQAAIKLEERYDLLKSHAKTQLERAYKDMLSLKEKHEAEINKLSAHVKWLEIKNASIQQSFDQKSKECAALADLCNEMTQSSRKSNN